jgi:sugar lactone lactonase YvrE
MRFGLPTGMAFDASGAVWVVDSGNNRIMRFFPDLP